MDTGGPPVNVVRFGVFEANLRSGELHKSGRRIPLQEQPFQLLAMLLARCGTVVPRDDIREKLWPGRTFVDVDHGIRTAINKIRTALGDDPANPRFVETLPRHGYRFLVPIVGGTDDHRDAATSQATVLTGRPPITYVAVLPFENLSEGPGQDYFADAMSEALVTNLGQVRGLHVISRTTTKHLRDTNKTVPDIGRELHVGALVEGTVLRSANHIRVTANLVDARTDHHLWAESYESELTDVVALQGELARAIAEQIKVELTPADEARLSSSQPLNTEAYEAYLKGIYALKRSAGGLVIGMQHFRDAIANDDRYAPAYVGLAVLYIQVALGYGSPAEALDESTHAALRALQLDATLAEPISCLAWAKAFRDWRWASADREFRCALERNPASSDVHRLYAWHLSAIGDHTEAVAQARRARELDPASLLAAYAIGAAFCWARDPDQIEVEADRLTQIDPTFPGAWRLRGAACVQRHLFGLAVPHFEREAALNGSRLAPWPTAYLAHVYAQSGHMAAAHKSLARLESGSKRQYVSPYLLAVAHTGLGNRDEAFRCLERAHAERNPMLPFLRVDSFFDSLRDDLRFDELVRRLGFPA